MDINPLSLLEVTMDSEAVEEDDDDECVIIEEPTETHVLDDTPEPPPISEAETEMLVDAGIHFLQQADSDPLSIPQNDTGSTQRKSMPILWVTTNLNNLATVTFAEHDYRKSAYKDVQDVLKERLHCTICLDHVGCDIRIHPSAIEHPVLKVLTCEKCTLGYKAVQFSLNEYGRENRCRWCAKLPREKGPLLRYCQQCPFSFCELCLYHNFPNLQPRHKPWTCFVCNLKQLWPARCTLWALQTLKARFISRPSSSNYGAGGDLSNCCRTKKPQKKPDPPKKAQRQVVRVLGNPSTNNFIALNGAPIGPKIFHVSTANTLTGGNVKLVKVAPPVPPPLRSRPVMPSPSLNYSYPTTVMAQPIQMTQSGQSSPEVTPENSNIDFDCIPLDWLKAKITRYKTDICKLSSKLDSLSNDTSAVDVIRNVDKKIETIMTVLNLSSNLMKDCAFNLGNEWKERKSRHVIEKLHSLGAPRVPVQQSVRQLPPNQNRTIPETSSSSPLEELLLSSTERPPITKTYSARKVPLENTQNSETTVFNTVPRTSIKPEPSLLRKLPNRKTKKSPSKPVNKPQAKKTQLSPQKIKLLYKKHNIKDCAVILERLPVPISSQRFIKFDRNNLGP